MIWALAAGALVTLVAGSAGWQPAAPLPLARSEVAAAAYGTGIVLVGGYVAGGAGKNTARADLYLPRQDRWRRLPDYPLPIDHAAAVGAGRRAYVVGGFGKPGNQVRVGYELENGRWRRLPKLPAPRAASGSALIGSKLYVVGGFAGEKLAQSMLVLDLRTARWSVAPGPTPRDHLGVTALAGRIYAVGGEKSEPGRELALVESWAPGERRWTRLPPISAARGGVALAAAGGAVIAAGGTNQRRPFATVQRLRPGAATWTSLPSLRTARHSIGLVPLGGRLYAIGGGQYALSVSSANEFLSLR
jgi:non-specific serine/threonine protein kinase